MEKLLKVLTDPVSNRILQMIRVRKKMTISDILRKIEEISDDDIPIIFSVYAYTKEIFMECVDDACFTIAEYDDSVHILIKGGYYGCYSKLYHEYNF